MAAGLPQITSQNPVDLGSGFEDPMDPCTMCMQGQAEIQQAYNELTQSCNACQTQQNLTQLQSQGCQGCAQAQQVIQRVQNQSTGCAACGTQQSTFTNLGSQMSSQPMVSGSYTLPLQAGQPMLMPLVGTSTQPLMTVTPQPGMMAGQLPISIERGPILPTSVIPFQQPMPMQSGGGMIITPMPMQSGGGMVTTPMPMQSGGGMVTTPSQPMQPVVVTPAPMPAPQPMQPVMTPTPIPPPPPAPIATQPMIATPQYTPAQVAGIQGYVASLPTTYTTGQGTFFGTAPAAGTTGYGVGGGKGPGDFGISLGPEGPMLSTTPPGFKAPAGSAGYGGGVSVGIGGFGPGAFDTHRPDLHAGGGWHNLLPKGAIENVFNLY